MRLLTRLFEAEIPPIDERFRPLAELYVAGFAVFYAVTFLSSLHFLFLGPWLGDVFTVDHLVALMDDAVAASVRTGNHVFWVATAGMVAFHVVFRAVLHYRSFGAYAEAFGAPLPLRDLVTWHVTNQLNALLPALVLLVLAGCALAVGQPAERGAQLFVDLAAFAHAQAMRVPTLVVLPNWLAFFVTTMAATFVHYWMHRLSHTRRLLWLLMHRLHHAPRHLAYVTTLPVVMATPLFLFMVVPYVFTFGALGKLFAEAPLYRETLLFQLVVFVGEIYGHSPALYERAVKNPVVRALSALYTQGVYHVLHHSAWPDSARMTTNNTVNLGPGFFGCWDRLFGTYMPLSERVPDMGLHGDPTLHMNPLRLLFAGIAQLGYELAHNRTLSAWWSILTGPTTYTPPRTRDFLLKDA